VSANQALEQARDSVLRYGEVVGRELLNLFVRLIMLRDKNPSTSSRSAITTLASTTLQIQAAS
jgi:hypothetical protein